MIKCKSIWRQLLLGGTSRIKLSLLSLETIAEVSPTLQSDNQDTLSGAGAPSDVTTKDPYQDVTQSSFNDYEDNTDISTVDEEGRVWLRM